LHHMKTAIIKVICLNRKEDQTMTEGLQKLKSYLVDLSYP